MRLTETSQSPKEGGLKSHEHKKILITSGRSPVTLDLARQLHSAGHEVFVADTMKWHVCRFSNAVTKTFLIPSPKKKSEAFIAEAIKIAEEEKIDLIIPIYEEIIHLAKASHRFPVYCKIFAPTFEILHMLHNKWIFNQKLLELGLDAPKTFLVRRQEDLNQLDVTKSYALKASYSRASQSIKKTIPHTPFPQLKIESQNPWIAQEWLKGDKFCTYSICADGVLKAHSTYPVGYTIDGSGCIVFKSVNHKKIRSWIEKFVKEVNFTGQIAFDFIEQPGGKLFAIECNPRATSGVHLFQKHDQLSKAFLNTTPTPIIAQEGFSKKLGIAMIMYGWRKKAVPNNNWKSFLHNFLKIKDVIIDRRDPFPFFAEPFVFIAILLNSLNSGLSIPAFFMHDYEWNGESDHIYENVLQKTIGATVGEPCKQEG
jgi:predicted ATP-grasp superfamily ATP-dependent carboligase